MRQENQEHLTNIDHEETAKLMARMKLDQLGEIHLESLSTQELETLKIQLEAQLVKETAKPDHDWNNTTLSEKIDAIEAAIKEKIEKGDEKYILQ